MVNLTNTVKLHKMHKVASLVEMVYMVEKAIWCKAKFIGRDPYWYTRRVKEAICIWLHPNNFNENSGIEIPKAWKPRIKQHNNRSMRTYEGMQSNNRNNDDDQNAPITANQRAKKIATCKSSTSSPDED